MSFQDCGGTSSASVPSWAQRANEPLVPVFDLQALKKDVRRDLKEIKKASEEIARLGRKKGSRDAGSQLLVISERTRELARGTSKRLRDALGLATEGTDNYHALTVLSDDFRAALKRFQQEAEAAAPDTRAAATPAMGTCAPIDIEVGVNGCQSAATATDAPTGLSQEQVQAQSQMQAVAFNDSIIREREEDIANIHRTARTRRSNPAWHLSITCLLYTSPSPRDRQKSRMPSSA